MVGANEWAAIEQLVDLLKQKYSAVAPGKIATIVHHNHARFDGRPVRDYVPLFVERGSRKELAELSGQLSLSPPRANRLSSLAINQSIWCSSASTCLDDVWRPASIEPSFSALRFATSANNDRRAASSSARK
jgi:hypothetical protein